MNRSLLAAAALVLACAPAVHAQAADSASRPNSLVKGARALSFDVGSASGHIGYLKMISDRSALGVQVGVTAVHNTVRQDDANDGDEAKQTGTNASLGMDYRVYKQTDRRLAPFAEFGGGVSYGRLKNEADAGVGPDEVAELTVTQYGANVNGGFGLQWFPVHDVSLTGLTGVTVFANRQTTPEGFRGTTVGVGTFTSSVSLQIYF
ncbi:MAG TPA: hypothetical protein VFH27_07380 [Longimicrobiaceae bacterium]|nr:hypothetical protein [Longimicrobiaceae bacterium]